MNGHLAAVVAAVVLAIPLFRYLPLAPDDPLRSTIALLPAILAALHAIGAWARSHGGRRTPPGVVFVELTVLALLTLGALARPGLGFRYPETVPASLIAAGFGLLLAHRIARLIVSLRPSLGRELPVTPGGPFFFLPLVAYLALLPWVTAHRAPDGDEPYNLLVAHSLAYDFDADLTNNYAEGDSLDFLSRRLAPQVGDPVGPNGELYSRHNLSLPLLLAPAYRVAGKAGALAMMAIIAALAAWMTLRLASRYFPDAPGGALLAWGLFAFTPPFLLYSYQVWTEIPAIVLTLVALDRILELKTGRPITRRDWLVLLATLALLPLVKLRYVLLSAGLLLTSFVSLPRFRRSIAIAGASLAGLASVVLVFNALAFDNPLKYQNWRVLRLPATSLSDHLAGASGILYDCAFGLFAVSPIWLLLWPALVLLVRQHRRFIFDFLLLFGLYLPFVTANRAWYGGWSPPMRYALVVLPLACLALAPLLERRRTAGARFLIAALGLLTLMLTLLWTVVPGWTYNMADGRSLLLDHLSSILDADATRFFASSIRPRLASFLWPGLSAAIMIGLWRWPQHARRGAAVAGISCALLSLPALAIAARFVPTRTIEFEDAWIQHQGGSIHPPRWTVSRHLYRGAWQLGPGNRVSAPLVGGGRDAILAVDLQVLRVEDRGVTLTVGNRERALASQDLSASKKWQTLRFELPRWPADGLLTIGLERRSPGSSGAVLLDRARIEWVDPP